MNEFPSSRIAVVIPCYRVANSVVSLIEKIGPEVSLIIAVDDACPDQSGTVIQEQCRDSRVIVLHHAENLGVGGAVMTGYKAACNYSVDIVVKLDGDGQMDPALIPSLVKPIIRGRADYVKGNRFYRISNVKAMPAVRLLGNAVS